MQPDLRLIEPRFKETIDAYIESGRPTGGFIDAVLRNDLKEAIGRGDNEAIDNLPHIVSYLYNKAPAGCWGNEGLVEEWYKEKRLNRIK